MLRQLITMLAVLTGLAAAPAAAEIRAAEPSAQLACATQIVVTAERTAVVAQHFDIGREHGQPVDIAATAQLIAPPETVRIGIDRARK